MMIATFLVFTMHLGFATLESGLCRAKNTVNILTKNVAIVLIGILMYAAWGFNVMYPGDDAWLLGKVFGFAGFGIGTDAAGVTAEYNPGYTYWTDFLFQAMFAATAATIVSGAVAERIKLMPFLVFTVLFVGILYPITGSWKWGKGWLDGMETPFYDFAGSTLVHAVGGAGALAGVLLLGPRLGKYREDGTVAPIPGHSMPLATIGTFLLFLGWFGFNGGSVLSADPAAVSLVFVTTTLAACGGGMAALFTSQLVGGKPDLSMALNGILAGLVGITAGADQMAPLSATVIGLIAGVLVVFSVILLDKLKLDDPVGAISVHFTCGVWGTLAVGLFGEKAGGAQLLSQIIGVVAICATAFVFALVVFAVLKATVGIRVSAEEEMEGLDIGEHGMEAYPDFNTAALPLSGTTYPPVAATSAAGTVARTATA
ncbi:MAG: ammonium transporter [Tepidisphaerales bacterium]